MEADAYGEEQWVDIVHTEEITGAFGRIVSMAAAEQCITSSTNNA
jgi:hypothetical protein